MGWVLRLVETGIDGQSRSSDVTEINRPDGLADIGHLGLTLAEAKQLLARILVTAQADRHGLIRPNCRSCGGRCRVKGWRPHQIATLFAGIDNCANRKMTVLRSHDHC